MTNKLKTIFDSKAKKRSIYFTAGYPKLDDTLPLLDIVQESGIDFVEIGIPFSDSIMDGSVILESHQKALENGMSIDVLFRQLAEAAGKINIPVVLMGSMNSVYQYGFERFCKKCGETGVAGILLPDLPPEDFDQHYRPFYEKYNLAPIFMISPQTSTDRLKMIDALGKGFLYAVSGNSTTGASRNVLENEKYLKTLATQNLSNPVMVGFNIRTNEDICFVDQFADGAILGSAFVKLLKDGIKPDIIRQFLKGLF